MSDGWAEAEASVQGCIAARPDEYDPATRAVIKDLFDLLRSTGRPAPSVGPGYWPTFCVYWDDAVGAENLQLEVFGDRVEVSRFHDGRTDIWYEDHAPGEGFSEAFIRELPGVGA